MQAALWKVDGKIIDLTRRALLMGVLNVTLDSFSDGGEFFATEAAVKHGLAMAQEGADIIDIGGESTRPGAAPVSPNDEMERVLPVIEQLVRASIPALISIDTSKATVARAALDVGAVIINDITGGGGDPAMLPLAAEKSAAVILMHMQGTPATMQTNPSYADVITEVADFFRQQFAQAVRCGVDPMCIALDPGIGFGKTVAHNLDLLANLSRLQVEDRPLVVGVSRKSFLGKIPTQPGDRISGTIALTSLLRARGAKVLRVHDVAQNFNALRTAEAVLAATR
ncbi:MAG: dihydropteroate synthase [Chthoniobacterales bacterium]